MDKYHSSGKEYFIPSVCFTNGRISSVSTDFITLTSYDEKYLLGLNTKEFSTLLRIISSTPFVEINVANDAFIYSSNLNPIEVTIIRKSLSTDPSVIQYLFIEKYQPTLKNRLPVINQLLITDSTGVCIYKVPELTIIDANNMFFKSIDKPYNSRIASIGKRISEILPDWDNNPMKELWNDVLTNEKTVHLSDFRHDFISGERHWDLSLTPVYLDNELKYYVEIIHEITDVILGKKMIEEQNKLILKQKNQLDSIINNVSDALIMIDIDYSIHPLNAAARKMTRLENTSKNIYEIMQDTLFYDINYNIIDKNDFPFIRILQGEIINNMQLIVKHPERTLYVSASGNPVYDENGNLMYGIVCLRNLEDIIKYETELKHKHDILYTMLDNLHLPIFKFSYPDLRLKQLNKKALDECIFYGIMDTPDQNIRERHISEVFASAFEDIKPGLEQFISTKNIVKLNNHEIIINNKKRIFNIVFQPLLDAKNEVVNVIIALFDISCEVEKHAKLSHILKLQEEFFSYISHEFKTPITVINASVQALQLMYKNEMTDKVNTYVNKIKKSSLQQLRLVNNLLDIIKADSGYLKLDIRYIDIVLLVRAIVDSISPFAKQRDVNIIFTSELNVRFVYFDDAKLERILLNLLSNALKFTPSGKSIYIYLTFKENDFIIEIIDEGPGIPRDRQKLIFEKYGQLGTNLTRTSEGTGIGLCLVNKLVQALRGELILESEEGYGSSFKIIFPTADYTMEEAPSTYNDLIEDRLVETMKVEFSDIYIN